MLCVSGPKESLIAELIAGQATLSLTGLIDESDGTKSPVKLISFRIIHEEDQTRSRSRTPPLAESYRCNPKAS